MAIAIVYDTTSKHLEKVVLAAGTDDAFKEATSAATFTATPIPTVSGGSGTGATVSAVTISADDAIESVTLSSGGTGYVEGDILEFHQGDNLGLYEVQSADVSSGVLQNLSGVEIFARTPDSGKTYAPVTDTVWDGLATKPTVDGNWQATVDANSKVTGFSLMTGDEATLKAAILSEARTYARACLDAMRPDWNLNFEDYRTATDQNPAGAMEMSDRYLNTWFWIMSPLKAIKKAHDDSGWTADQLQVALDAYRELVPLDKIAAWYMAHNRIIWGAYREPDSTNSNRIRCYFKWTKGAALPAFASDAASSTAWDGTGNTEDAYYTSFNAQPETTG